MISVVSNGSLAANGSLAMSAALIKLGGTSFGQAGTLAITAPVLEIETGSGLTQANLGCDQCTTPADITKFANIGDQNAVGAITFQNLSAPETNVLIWAGAGTVTGTIDVKGLGMAGAGGSADLAGTIDGLASIAAANLAIKGPKADAAYRINDCVIATPNCVVLPQIVPVLPLLLTLSICCRWRRPLILSRSSDSTRATKTGFETMLTRLAITSVNGGRGNPFRLRGTLASLLTLSVLLGCAELPPEHKLSVADRGSNTKALSAWDR